MQIYEFIVLLTIAWLAAIISGFAGFGGGLILLPLLVAILGAKSAIPVLTIAQLFGNASRVYFGRKELEWKYITVFMAGAFPATILGAFTLWFLDGGVVRRIIGAFLIAWVIYRKARPSFGRINTRGLVIGGTATGLLSGAVGSAGPLGAAMFLSLGLSPGAYVASEAVTALCMHATKLILYPSLDLMNAQELLIGLLLGLVMITGSYLSKMWIEKIPKAWFQRIVEGLLLLSGLGMLLG